MNAYEVARDAQDKFHARNMDTGIALCGATDFVSALVNRNTSAVAAWTVLDGRDASCKTCEQAAKSEYFATIKGA
jgi:hypothetical protein